MLQAHGILKTLISLQKQKALKLVIGEKFVQKKNHLKDLKNPKHEEKS